MASDSLLLTADFPRTVRGYAPSAVDEFLRSLGSRLDALQNQLDQQAARCEKLTADLSAQAKELAGYRLKEAALAGALVATEQRRAEVEQEAAGLVERAWEEAEGLLAHARAEAEQIVGEARVRADQLVAEARQARQAEEARILDLCAEFDAAVETMRRTLEAHLALLPEPGSTLAELSLGGLAVADAPDSLAQAA